MLVWVFDRKTIADMIRNRKEMSELTVRPSNVRENRPAVNLFIISKKQQHKKMQAVNAAHFHPKFLPFFSGS